MHYDPELFDDPETCQYDRFLDPTAKTRKGTFRSSHLRPFGGGGAHLCPFISYEARVMLVMMLLELDMRLSSEEESTATPCVLFSLDKESMSQIVIQSWKVRVRDHD